jgi:hypothetical protein
MERLEALVLIQDVGGDQALLEVAVGIRGGRRANL